MSIKLKNINIDYGNFLAVDNLNMEIEKGELVSLLGPSGCGKTTALNAIAGLINTTSGQMLFDGVDVTQKPSQKRNIGLVFQSYALYTHMNVFKNIAYPLYHSKTFKKELKQENYLNKLRLKTLIEAEGYELIINQQTKFDNFIINFKEDLDKLIDEELVNFLRANKAALNEYLDLAFAENDESDLRVINAKNQLKSYLYDKSKIKFNQKVNELNIYLNKNIKEILKNPHDVRFTNLLKFFEYNIQNSINEFQSHSSEIAKTMKKTKRNISKLEDHSIGLAIFTGSRTASYDVFVGKRKEIEKDFFNNEFKHSYNLVDQFLLEVNQYLSTNVFVNSAYSKLILKVNTSLKKSIKDITTKISGDSKIGDKTKLVNFILINSKETIIAKIRAHNDELKNVMTQYIEFIDKTNYFVNDFESVILPLFNVETVSIEENTRNLKYKDEFIKEVSNSLQEIFKASFLTVDKELSSKSLKIDTTEKQNEIKKQIFSRNRKIKELVYQTAKQVEIENQLNKKPSELSGGQQQRVAIARAIVKKPGILLMDEPLSNLDAKLRLTTREWIKRFQQSVGITTIFVTHDQEEAMSISDSIFVMNKGVLQQSGTPLEIYNKPANEFVANFIGTPNINFLSVKKSKNTFALPSGEILKYNNLPEDQTEFKLGIRPEKITLKKTAGSILLATGSVILVEQLGKQNHIKIKVSKDLELTLVSDPAEWASIKNKDEINLYINKKEIYVFGKDKNLVEATYAK